MLDKFESYKSQVDLINDIIEANANLKKDIYRLEKALEETVYESTDLEEEKEEVVVEDSEEIEEDTIGEAVDFYYDEIRKYEITGNIEDDMDYLREVLPVKESGYYKKIILRIILNLTAEMNEFRTEIERLRNECTEEELEDYFREVKLIKAKIQYIRAIDAEKEISKFERVKNKLVFMTKSGDKTYAQDDLSMVPVDYNEAFVELFDSIVDGSFKNVRYFKSSNNKNSGVAEVKGFKVRILFDRIGRHTYAILACFVKKSDNDKDYREFVNGRVSTYRVKRQNMIDQLSNEEYLNTNEEILNSIYSSLNKEVPSNDGRGLK